MRACSEGSKQSAALPRFLLCPAPRDAPHAARACNRQLLPAVDPDQKQFK